MVRRLGWLAYQLAFGSLLLLAAPWFLLRRGGHYLPTLAGRLGRYRDGEVAGRGGLWLHAVSVGEVGVAATLARALPEDLPLVVTTVTPTGQERARRALGERAAAAYLPFDLGFAVGRFLRRFEPRGLLLVEGDYWPLTLAAARRRGLPVRVVNGRVGDRSFARMRRLGSLPARLLAAVDAFGVQSELDRERLLALGVPREKVAVTGNLKFETPEPPRHPELEAHLRRLAGGRALLVAGSTMAGEEEQVLAAFESLGGGDRAFLVLAPRHPERWDGVAELVRRRGLTAARRSRFPMGGASGEAAGPETPDLVLLDSLGELAGLYRVAAAAFVGGTLVPTGGHNPIEAARYAVPVAVGPSMDNFRDLAGQFDRAGAWRRVSDARDLARAWDGWLTDPAAARRLGERGAELVAANRGALARTLELVGPVLEVCRQELNGGRSGEGGQPSNSV